MESVSEHLLSALDELDTDELKRFKWHLKNHKGFSAADLEKADAPDTVDLMMKRFTPEEAVKITVDILRKMNLNQLLSALDELVTDELKRFKWHLKSHEGFSAAGLEKADAPDTVDLMMKRFTPEEAVKITVDILREMNLNQMAEDLENKHKQDTSTNIVPRTRKDFLQYACFLTLDPNTAHTELILSEDNRKATGVTEKQPYPDHPDRFDYWRQVLCRESVCGRCYWEIECSGDVYISVSYKSISRKGAGVECVFGSNDQSWRLICSPSSFSFRHNKIKTDLPVKPIISRTGVNGDIYRVGVYVDFSAGTLSFFSVSDTMSLIHTQHTTFTQTLYPGFTVCSESSVKLC
ncbi:hypothetical protein Q8A67_012352 [Cirrhinus molitorella]|uniref:Uncharacterized protein n=1 Tax=Cirrhinus molitorella TaxID=172907 RepID=A0AA88PMT8_9TELE|nr:hypothetical protein Q8A67_012352 [Cirrhinus molitorella]